MRIPPRHTQALAVTLLGGATGLTLAILIFVIVFILGKGLPVKLRQIEAAQKQITDTLRALVEAGTIAF